MKSIILCRTSTSRQEIEAQIDETKAFALADGCNEEDLVVIAKQGASAIKLDAAYMENIQRVKNEIEAGGVSCVYAWALDRIGRNEVVMMQFKEYLIKKKVQLKIKNPALVLLDSDGTINSGMEIAFTLYITLAKQEMEQKKARFARSRKVKKERKQYLGGGILFGYTVDENQYHQPNPETAHFVQDAFNMYATGNYSMTTLAEILRHRGWGNCQLGAIVKVLSNPAYIGKHSTYKCPPLVDEQTFNACRAVAQKQSTKIGKTKQYWLGARLMECPVCGNHLVAKGNRHNFFYTCPNHTLKSCAFRFNMQIGRIDPLLFEVALPLETKRLQRQMKVNKEVLYADLNTITGELESRETEYNKKIKKAIDRLNTLYIDGVIEREEYNERRTDAVAKADALKAKIDRLRLEKERLQRQIESADYMGRSTDIYGYTISMNAEEVSTMIHRHILKVTFERKDEKHMSVFIHTTEEVQEYLYTQWVSSKFWHKVNADGTLTAVEIPNMDKSECGIIFHWGKEKPWKMSEEEIADYEQLVRGGD